MKSLVEFFVKRPMFANLIIIIIFGFGIYSIANMRKEAYPEITMGRFTITCIYPGASAEDVEINLTVPIENAIKELENIQELTSISREGLSIINIVLICLSNIVNSYTISNDEFLNICSLICLGKKMESKLEDGFINSILFILTLYLIGCDIK